ncbi:MAG: phosphodiester glycosidase family protein, partial [Bacteroidota bacterium]
YFTPGSHNKYIRSGVGVISPNQIVFIISRQPVNFYDFARIFRDYFKCKNALYLDGAISKMFLPEIGRFDLGGEFGPMIGIIK